MKKAIIIILTIFAITFSFAFYPTDGIANAEGIAIPSDYRANSDIQVYKYIDGVETPLFIIPATYYFNIYKSGTDKYYINYVDSKNSDSYFIKTDADFVPLTDKDVEPLGGFKVALSLNADSSYYKYEDQSFTEVPLVNNNTSVITFIGFGTYNEKSCAYVSVVEGSSAQTYGYVEIANLLIKDSLTPLAEYQIEPHRNSRDVTITPTEDENGKTEIDNEKLKRIILIIGIVVPALVILLLLFKPSKKNRYDYDRNRNYDMGSSPYDRPRSRYRDDYYDDYNRPPPPRGYDNDDDYYDNRGGRRY